MPSVPTIPSFPYGAIKRHVRDVLGFVSVKKHWIDSWLLGNPSAKRMSDGAEAKSVHCSDMLSLSPTVSPIEQTDKRGKESACDVDAHDFSQRVAQTSESQSQPLTAANISLLPGRPDPHTTMMQYIQAIPPPPCSSSWFDSDGRISSSSIVKVYHNPRDYAHYSCCSSLGGRTLGEEYYADDEGDEDEVVISGPTLFLTVDDEGCVVGNEMGGIESDSQGSTVEEDDGDKSQFAWICTRDLD